MDTLRRVSDGFGRAVQQLFEQQSKDFALEGGGLRHGSPEWHVAYRHEGLLRLIVFALEGERSGDVRLRVHAAATDEHGGWVHRDLGSTVLERVRAERLEPHDVEQVVEQARSLANSFSVDDVAPLAIGWDTLTPSA